MSVKRKPPIKARLRVETWTWRGPEGLIHLVTVFGAWCGHVSFRGTRVSHSQAPRVPTCIECCAEYIPQDEEPEDVEEE